MKQVIFIIILVLTIPSFVESQNIAGNDIRLAYEYYNNKDFDKAEILFKKISEKTGAKVYFTYYINCLTEQGKFDIAEKAVKKEIRKHKNNSSYYIDLGYIFKRQNRFDEAKTYFEKALKKMRPDIVSVRATASAFMQRREFEYAEKAYLKGVKLTGEKFRNELANLYAVQRKYDKMINEYLDMLEESPGSLSFIQNRMQYFTDKDVNGEFAEILRKELLKRIQKRYSPVAFNKMLVWFYMQRKDFASALIQEKAIDKRTNSSGKRILDLAEIAKSEKDYETAEDAYSYVINKGKNRPFYIEANVGKLNTSYRKIIENKTENKEEILKLEKEYTQTLKSLGIGFNTIQSVTDLAHLKAFYLNKPDEAISLLKEALALRGLNKRLAAMCEIELADIYVFKNELDYAVLTYAKVEIENKGSLIADSAKLKKAKAAYYSKNFKWAKAQFDALKESTSKPVANDALFYSLLIEENTEGDSLQSAMKMYSEADLYIFRNKKDSAVIILDSLLKKFPGHQITDEVYYMKAKIYYSVNNFIEAEKQYKKIIEEYPYDILSDRAMFDLAVLYETKLNDKEQAAEYYKKLMLEHPDSIFVTEARRKFRKLREKQS